MGQTRGIETITFDDDAGTIWTRAEFETFAARNFASTGDDMLLGTAGDDVLEGLQGNDFISGGEGDDTYIFTKGDGVDILRDSGSVSGDALTINGYSADEIRFSRFGVDGADLIIRFSGSEDEITIINGLVTNGTEVVETITLGDNGETFSLSQIRQLLIDQAATDERDTIVGSDLDDTLNGGAGRDVLLGGLGDDTYIYRAGDGVDRIIDNQGVTEIILADYTVDDINFAVRTDPLSEDLVIQFSDGSDRLFVENAFSNPRFSSRTVTIEFADGEIWDQAALQARALYDIQSEFDDNVFGFNEGNIFEGSKGDDVITGRSGDDIYRYERGDGHDTIEEGTSTNDTVEFLDFVSSEVFVETLFIGSFDVVFRFASSPEDSLTVRDAISDNSGAGIEKYVFTDGVEWTKATLDELLANEIPNALDDGFFTAIGTEPIIISSASLIRNDFDADNDPLTIISVDGGENGTAEINANGDIIFTANDDFTGSTEFTYYVSDGRNGIAQADVNLRVRPRAEARDDDGFSVDEDGLLTIETLRLLSNDVDGDRLIVASVFGAENGTVSLSSNGEVQFSPDANYNGLASFSYIANTPDGGVAEARVYIDVNPINDAPVARNDFGYETLEDVPFQIEVGDLLANDFDVDDTELTVSSVISNADVQVTLEADGVISVVPRDFFFGDAFFDYVVEDAAGETATGRVSLFVEAVNNAPELNDDRISERGGELIREDNPIIISIAELLANDIDRDNDDLTFVRVSGEFGGDAQVLDNDTILFTPDANFNGEARFTYVVTDGKSDPVSATAVIEYQAVNDNPIARDDHYEAEGLQVLRGTEDVPLEIPIIELLKNDSDIEGQFITFESTSPGVDGEITIRDGNTIVYTPDADFWGETTFSYLISDEDGAVGAGEVTLFFENVGDAPPEVGDDQVTLFEDVPIVIPIDVLLANDTDIDRDPLEFVRIAPISRSDLISLALEGSELTSGLAGELNGTLSFNSDGDIVFTPNENATSASGFKYFITDNVDGEAFGFVDLNLIPVDDEPTVVDDEGGVTPFDVPLVLRATDLIANDFDVDGGDNGDDFVSFAGIDSVDHGTGEILEVAGETFVVIRPEPGYTGELTIQYRVTDTTGLEDTGFITGTVSSFYNQNLIGTPEIDLLIGNGLDETISGLEGDDALFGEGGDDILDGGDGADLIDGGEGFDTVSFDGSNTGVRADLVSRLGQGGFAQGDLYTNIEALAGSQFNDDLFGNDADNTLIGRGGRDELIGRGGNDILIGGTGDDRLHGGAGADELIGGEGSDTADYSGLISGLESPEAVEISLTSGIALGGDAQGDTLEGIENLIGTIFADTLEGNEVSNLLRGGRGDDVLRGLGGDDILIGGRGADTLLGGEGVDIADYSLSIEGITIDLADTSASGGDATGDVYDSIEIIQASFHDDILRGDDNDNILRGGRGADVIDGRGGFDVADYSQGDEAVVVNLLTGTGLAGEALGDTLISIEKLIGSNFDDELIGGNGVDTFDGGFGKDLLRGGFGSDRYLFGDESGEDRIIEAGNASDIDQVVLGDTLAPKDISLVREGDDLLIEIERDSGFLIDTLRVSEHFVGRETGIEEILFANGLVWDRDTIDDLQRLGRFNAEDDIFLLGVEDEIATIVVSDLLANDAAEGVGALELVSVGNGVDGTATLNDDGTISFIGDQDINGDTFFEYVVRDQFGRESSARVEVNLSPVNDAPIAFDDGVFNGQEDVPLIFRLEDLVGNDFDVDGDNLTITSNGFGPLVDFNGSEIESFGEAELVPSLLGDAIVRFTPTEDHFGFAGFTYTVTDPDGLTSVGSVELFFAAVNDPARKQPGLGPDFEFRLGLTSTISFEDLLNELRDIEGDEITLLDVHSPNNASVTFDDVNEQVVFVPSALGLATFELDTVDARGAQSTVTINVNVRPLNDPPVARDDRGFTTDEDTILLIDPADLLANDTDENGDVLVLTSLERFPLNGRVELTDEGMIQFTPRSNFNGAAGFTYEISDGRGGFDEAFVEITILPSNDGAILFDDVITELEDIPIFVIPGQIFGNDIEPEGDVIFFEDVSVLGTIGDSFLSDPVIVTAGLSDGSDLPQWLSFDDDGLAFSGVVPAGLAENLNVTLRFEYPEEGISFERVFELDVSDPELLLEGVSFESELPEGYKVRAPISSQLEFAVGILSDDVNVSATLTDGTDLPEWLVFDEQTLSFSGEVPADTVTSFETLISFVYSDPSTGEETRFDRLVEIDPTSFNEGVSFDSNIAVLDIGNGSFDVQRSNGRQLPDWLQFDFETFIWELTDIAPDADAGLARVQVVFTPDTVELPENTYSTLRGGFAIEFVIDPAAGIDPAVNALIQNDAFFAAQSEFGLSLDGAVEITALRDNLAPLPEWLSFDPETLTFNGTPPVEYVGSVPVRIDVTGNGSDLPSFSILTEVVVDPTFEIVELRGEDGNIININTSVGPENETIDVSTSKDFNGPIALTYTSTDDKGGISEEPGIIVINILPQPELPEPSNDEFSVDEDGTVSFMLSDILENDVDDDGDVIRVVSLDDPTHGTLEIERPITVINIANQVPVLVDGIYSASLQDGSDLPDWLTLDSTTGVLTGDVPLEFFDTLLLDVSVSNSSQTHSLTLDQTFDGNQGVTVTYTPEPGYNGSDAFEYTISDFAQGTGSARVELTVIPVNDPPLARNDQFDGLEDTDLVLDASQLLENDTDFDGDPLTITAVSNPSNGSVRIEGNQIIFTPTPDFDGRAGFDYTVSDGADGTDQAGVSINVISTNTAPEVVTDTYNGFEDTVLVISPDDLLANDFDVDGDAISFVSIDQNGTNVNAFNLPSGEIQLVPILDFNGTAFINYFITDGRKQDRGFIEINFAPVNDAPVANNDTGFITQEDTPIIISLDILLANDLDKEGDSFSIVEVFDGDNGTVILDGGNAVFTPRADFFGNAAFKYRVEDENGGVSIGEVSLLVEPGNDLPVAVSDILEVNEDERLIITADNLIGNDVDADGDVLSLVSVNGNSRVAVTDLGNGEFELTPDANLFGTVNLTYQVADASGLPITGFITLEILPVPDAPIAVDDTFDTLEDTSFTITTLDVTGNDTDADLQAVQLDSIIATQGLSVEFGAFGQLTIIPDDDFAGTAFFDYQLSDSSGLTDIGRVTVNVAAINDAPVIGELPVLVATEDTFFSVALPEDAFTDVDSSTILIGVFGKDGSALPEWLSFDSDALVISGTPPQDFYGEIELEVVADDLIVGTRKSVILKVTGINDAPVVATPLSDQSSTEDAAVSFALPADAFTDVDGDTLILSAALANGDTLPAWLVFDADAGSFAGTPPQDFNGDLDVTVSATDGEFTASDTFTLSIAAVNDAPVVATPLADQSSPEDTAVNFALPTDAFSDVDGDTLTLSAALANGDALPAWLVFDADAGSFAGTPPLDFNGNLDVTVSATDGEFTASDTFTLSIASVNDAPVVATPLSDQSSAEDTNVSFALPVDAFSDVDGDTLTLSAALANGDTLPAWLVFDADAGSFAGTPPQDFNGGLYVTVSATDGEFTVSDTFTLSIAAENDAPVVATPLSDQSSAEDTNVSFTLPSDAFSDVDGDTLNLTALLADGTPLPVWLVFDADAGSFTGTPPQDFNGDLDVTVSATDGEFAAIDTFTLSIAAVNDAPVAQDDVVQATEDQVLVVPLQQLLANDSDVDGDTLAITSVSSGENYQASLDGVGNVVVSFDADFNGEVTLDYTVSDGELTDTATTIINVAAVNDAPVVNVVADVTSDEDAEISFEIPANVASDVDGDALTITAERASGTELPAWLSFDADNRRFTGTPPANFFGTIGLAILVSDGEAQARSTFDLVIEPVNDIPVLSGPFSDRFIDEDEIFDVELQSALASDVDGDALSFDVKLADGSDLPQWLGFDAGRVALTGMPPENFNGEIDLRIFISDGEAQISDEFILTVRGVNDAPIVVNPLEDILVDPDNPDDGIFTGEAFSIPVPADTFEDVDGDPLQFAALLADGASLPEWLTFDGSELSGIAPREAVGTYEVEIRATDGEFEASDTFFFTVQDNGPVNSAPIAQDDGVFDTRGEIPIRISLDRLLANDIDPDGDPLQIVSIGNGINGTVSVNNNGVIVYTANDGFVGEDAFEYAITDGVNLATATVNVRVDEAFDNVENGSSGNDVLIGDFRSDNYINGGRGDDLLFSGRGDDTLIGGAGNDSIFSGAGNDTIRGGSGNDLAFAGSGDDVVNGGSGDDLLFGGRGNDRIIGGTGDDLLFGGRGSDTFVFRSGDGSDTIFGYEASRAGRRFNIEGDQIRLQIDGINSFDDLLASGQEQNGGVLFDLGNGDEIFLAGTQLSALDKDDFTFF